MPKLNDKQCYRLKYQYDLMEQLLGIKRASIRKKMKRAGLGSSTEDFVESIKNLINRE